MGSKPPIRLPPPSLVIFVFATINAREEAFAPGIAAKEPNETSSREQHRESPTPDWEYPSTDQ